MKCPKCNGSKTIVKPAIGYYPPTEILCDTCNGTGELTSEIEKQVKFVEWLKDVKLYNPVLSLNMMQFGHQVYYEVLKSDEWIKVTDNLPKESVYCLIWDDTNREQRIHPFCVECNCWGDEEGDDYYTDAVGGNITHWKPLGKRPVKE